MIQRCTNPKLVNYDDYGGRGITVCERWGRFDYFLIDMGECPAGQMLERNENDGPYSKENCRWATRIEQNNNRRSNHFLEFRGRRLTIAQLAREVNVPGWKICKRVNNGYSVEEAIAATTFVSRTGRVYKCRSC